MIYDADAAPALPPQGVPGSEPPAGLPPAAQPHPPSQDQITAHRLQNIARITGATRSLEIGVEHGATFFEVDLPHEVAVDPQFRFDTSPQERPGTSFHAVPSDAFFRSGGGHPS